LNTTASIIYSIFLFYGLFAFAGALLLFIQFKGSKPAYVTTWLISSVLVGIATSLAALRDVVPEVISFEFAHGLNIASYIYVYASCLSLLGRDIRLRRIAVWAFIASVAFLIVLAMVNDRFGLAFQPAVVALGGMALNFFSSWLVLKLYRQRQTNLVRLLLAAFMLSAVVWSSRFLMVVFYGVGFAFEGGIINAVTFTLLLVLGITRYMCFIGVVTSIEVQKKEELIAENHFIKLALAHKKVEQTESHFLASLNALAKARDNETGNHIIRTQQYVRALAQRLYAMGHYIDCLSEKSIDVLVRAAPLHDIGKIGIPDAILLKEGSLSVDEWTIMKTHALIGESVLDVLGLERDKTSDVIDKAIKIAGGHHEKWDGTGYPRGLAGEAIPLEARIMSLADMYDALMSERPYKKAWSHDEAVVEIISKRHTQFDPLIVDAFVYEQEAFKGIAQKYRDS
jgi:HD-GYP domain-containing protein (c-di-GMP phosphodiesterase class II)